MQKFSYIEEKFQLKILSKNRWGDEYVYYPSLKSKEKMLVIHFNGEFKPEFTQVYADIVTRMNNWINSKNLLEYVEVELVREVGEDFIILPYYGGDSLNSLNAIDEWDKENKPKNLEIMQKRVRSEIGKAVNEKEKLLEEILVRSLLDLSSDTIYDCEIKKFIITEPRLKPEHLEKWRNSNA